MSKDSDTDFQTTTQSLVSHFRQSKVFLSLAKEYQAAVVLRAQAIRNRKAKQFSKQQIRFIRHQ
jgi:hypothetical protein